MDRLKHWGEDMPHRLRSHLTYANIVASLALFVALGGSAAAVTTFPRDSVGTDGETEATHTLQVCTAGATTL